MEFEELNHFSAYDGKGKEAERPTRPTLGLPANLWRIWHEVKERVLTFDCRHPDCEASHTISAYSWDWQRPLRIECFALERSHFNEITKVDGDITGGVYRINLIGRPLHEIFAEEAGAGEGDGSEGATEESPSASLREDAVSPDPQTDHSRPSSVVPDTPVIRKYRIQVGKMWTRRREIRDE